jgi:FKBP-type peptidyl-prolyl cis-trans isomerase SlpA
MTKIQHDSEVAIYYQLFLEDGTEVESNRDDEVLRFTMGDGTLTDGMEQGLLEKTTGEHAEIMLSPEQGYGYPEPENVHTMPVSDFPADMAPEEGQIIAFDGPDDEEIVGTIIKVGKDDVDVDFSHPLAGRNLLFKAEIVEVNNPD